VSDDPRTNGRPPLAGRGARPSVPVCLRIPSHTYDRVYQRASAQGVSVPEILRRDLRRRAAAAQDDDDAD